jgi:hypothetical protein
LFTLCDWQPVTAGTWTLEVAMVPRNRSLLQGCEFRDRVCPILAQLFMTDNNGDVCSCFVVVQVGHG